MKYVIVLLLLTCSLHAQILEMSSFKEMPKHVNKKTLVILDIDDTLLIPVQMLGCDEWFCARLKKHQADGHPFTVSLERALAEWESVRHITEMEIVEEESKEIVNTLQDKGVMVMGMTTQGLALATRTVHQLSKVGIDLAKTAPTQDDCYLSINGNGVLFRKGVFFTSGQNKGEALMVLLRRLGFKPEKIVYVDDKGLRLKSVEEVALAEEIEFVGLRYAYSDERKQAFSLEVADFQFTHSSFDRLLSDEDAHMLLNLEKKAIADNALIK